MEAVFILYDLLEKPCMDLSYTLCTLWKHFLRAAFSYLHRIKTCFNFLYKSAHFFLFVELETLCLKIFQLITANWILIFIGLILVRWFYKRQKINQHKDASSSTFLKKDTCSVSGLFNMIKDCDNPIFAKEVISQLEDAKLDTNAAEPNSCSGLTPFLCACMSGSMELVEYMLKHGANINSQTACQDGPLHIATFACANQNSKESFDVLAMLIKTGADPSICNNNGVYPIDFATNAGNIRIASLLAINLPNPYVWDFIEPHTPPRIKLGLQTPSKQHLVQSSFNRNKRKLNTFRTPRPIRTQRL